MLIKLGVHNGQGYYLRKPNEELKGVEEEAMKTIENYGSYRAYCKRYGDKKGDEIIDMMKDIVAENMSEVDTMAMLDQDTIVCIVEKSNCKIVSEIIVNKFRNRIREYYQKGDWDKGYIESTNKHGEVKKYPLIDICSERVV